MRNFLILILLGAFALSASAQVEAPDDLDDKILDPVPEDLLRTRPKFMQGIYQYSFPYGIESDFPDETDGQIDSERRWTFKYKIPLFLGDRFNLLAGHTYRSTRFHFSENFDADNLLPQLSGRRLRSNRFSVYGRYEIKPNKQLLTVVSSIAFNGDYEKAFGFSPRYRIWRFIATYTFQTSLNDDFTIGLYYKEGFRNRTFLPFAVWNKAFNEKWGLEAILITRAYLRHNATKDDIFLFGYDYSSQDFSADVMYEGNEDILKFKWPKLVTSAVWQHRFLPFLWTELEAGFQYNFRPKTELEFGAVPEKYFEMDSHNAMINVSLFLSPPDKFLRGRR